MWFEVRKKRKKRREEGLSKRVSQVQREGKKEKEEEVGVRCGVGSGKNKSHWPNDATFIAGEARCCCSSGREHPLSGVKSLADTASSITSRIKVPLMLPRRTD